MFDELMTVSRKEFNDLAKDYGALLILLAHKNIITAEEMEKARKTINSEEAQNQIKEFFNSQEKVKRNEKI